MAKLVYIPSIKSESWLHWSYSGEASRLRLYQRNMIREVGPRTTLEVEQCLKQLGTKQEPAPKVPWFNSAYWYQTIRLRNIESGYIEDTEDERLLACFNRDLNQVWSDPKSNDAATIKKLELIIKRWINGLAKANDFDNPINHWDVNCAFKKIASDTGIGWEAYLLEACRANSSPRFMKVNGRNIFFAAMEASIGIPAAKNVFVPNRRGAVKPDGLGVDHTGNVIVFEFKGPQDVLDPLLAVNQAVLGALAVYAKRKHIIEQLKNRRNRRPPIKNACIDKDTHPIIANVFISTCPGRQNAPRVTEQCNNMIRQLLAASDVIQEISIMRINKATRGRFHKDHVQKLQPYLPSLNAVMTWPQ